MTLAQLLKKHNALETLLRYDFNADSKMTVMRALAVTTPQITALNEAKSTPNAALDTELAAITAEAEAAVQALNEQMAADQAAARATHEAAIAQLEAGDATAPEFTLPQEHFTSLPKAQEMMPLLNDLIEHLTPPDA